MASSIKIKNIYKTYYSKYQRVCKAQEKLKKKCIMKPSSIKRNKDNDSREHGYTLHILNIVSNRKYK